MKKEFGEEKWALITAWKKELEENDEYNKLNEVIDKYEDEKSKLKHFNCNHDD